MERIKMQKTALITGSYGGLGTCFVELHAATHGDVILVGRSKEKLEQQKQYVEKTYSVSAHIISVDLSTEDAAQFIF